MAIFCRYGMTTFEMRRSIPDAIVPLIAFDPASAPLHRQICDGYRAAILGGRLRPGQRVPSSRALARELGISRLPVLNAFEQLLHEGYLEGRVGSGTYVASSIVSNAGGSSGRSDFLARYPLPGRRLSSESSIRRAEPAAFRVSLPALDHFPRRTWARLVSRHARRMPIEQMTYGEPAGCLALRQAIADYLRTARAVACEAGQVLIVSGSQMGLQLCARVLLKTGDTFCVEEPGYPGAREALAATGAAARAVPVDDDGLMVRSLDSAKQVPRAVYVTPSHQYPLGVSMNATRRLELLDWARRHRSWIVEDDYDNEYRYASRPLGALQGMDAESRVVYLGTFSKVLFPALRIGFIVAPLSLVDDFIAARRAFDLFSPTLNQLALTDFLCEGHFARHVRRMRTVYRKRRDVLLEEIERRLGGTLTVVNADAGLHLTAWLPQHIDDRDLARRAARRGVSVTALSTLYAGDSPKSGLVLGFGGADEETIARAVETLARTIDEARRC